MTNTETIIEIDPREVKFLIHRDRDAEGFRLLKEAIRAIGVRQPLHVRDISGWPAKDRRRPDGGLYKWEALFGEGRTTACLELHNETHEKRWLKLPAILKDVPENAVVSAFLAENLLRRKHSWLDQAKLIQADVKNGASLKDITKAYFITEPHATKLLRILTQMSPMLRDRFGNMPLKTAVRAITLPKKSQNIILETMTEEGLDESQLPAVLDKAKEITDDGKLSKTALKQSVRRVQEDLDAIRPQLKLLRLHHSLCVPNIELLLEEKPFRKELDRLGINYARALAVVKQ